jgi:hypothetical protein
MFTQKRRVGNKSKLDWKRAKGSPARQMKSTTDKKEKMFTLTPGDNADGRR